MYLENVKRLSERDVFARAGGAMRALKITLPVTVSDGVLNLYFAKGTAVTDARGRVLLPDGHRVSGENGLEIGTESLPRGLFLLRIHAGHQTQTLKFLKQ